MAYIGAGISRFNTADELTVTGDAQIDGTTLVIDSTNNRVGVGTASPATALDVTGTVTADGLTVDGHQLLQTSGTGNIELTLKNNNASPGSGRILFADTAASDAGVIQYEHGGGADAMVFKTATNEAMRIDSSGNLLVSTTDTNPTNDSEDTFAFVVNKANHQVRVRSHDLSSLRMNRTGTDGDITQFYKDGTTVGSIGVYSNSYAYVGTGDTGVYFDTGVDAIIPHNTTTNSTRGSALSLGWSTVPFKDAYLSGGVYLGGTGSANHLDDYEEGTFTATCSDAASGGNQTTTATGIYVKIGRLVHFQFSLTNINTTGMTSSNTFHIQGLPFNAPSGYNQYVSLKYQSISFSLGTQLAAQVQNGNSYVRFREMGTGSGGDFLLVSEVNDDAGDFDVSGTYYTGS